MEFNGTFFVTIISFIIFVLLMNKILYEPILGIMQKRANLIDENYKLSEENRAKADSLIGKKSEKLNEARIKAKNSYVDSLDEYHAKKSELVSGAQKLAKDELKAAEIDFENLSNEVKVGLRDKMVDLANVIVEKVLGYKSDVQHFDVENVNKVLWNK